MNNGRTSDAGKPEAAPCLCVGGRAAQPDRGTASDRTHYRNEAIQVAQPSIKSRVGERGPREVIAYGIRKNGMLVIRDAYGNVAICPVRQPTHEPAA